MDDGVVWKPSRLVVIVGDRKLEDGHSRDMTGASPQGVGKPGTGQRSPYMGGTEKEGLKQSCKSNG